MLFNSIPFIFGFLPLVLAVNAAVIRKGRTSRLLWLTLSSYAFYAYWNYAFLPIIVGSALVDYLVGPRIYAGGSDRTRRAWLCLSIGANLSTLVFFKYFDFAAAQANQVLGWLHYPPAMPLLGVAVPIGISFTVFESISYSVDLYRQKIRPAPDFLSIACFVSVFPRMIAGPIIRYAAFAPQMDRDPRTRNRADDAVSGMLFLASGLAKKVLIADSLAQQIDPLLAAGHYQQLGMLDAWFVVLGFAYQIYFDFSGYSDMAVGLGKWLGFDLPRNFSLPYRAVNIREFWHRWHITLSTWLRDYLYIPLGGSHRGHWMTSRNIMITMVLGGLWHGASWTFICWGAYHGLALVVHRQYERLVPDRQPGRWSAWATAVLTFGIVLAGWVLFRSETPAMSASLWRSMAGLNGTGLTGLLSLSLIAWLAMAVAALAAHLWPDTWDLSVRPRFRVALTLGVFTAVCTLWLERAVPFLYFQF